MKTRHVRAKDGEIADIALISDDYDRIKHLSKMLEGCKLVSNSRGFLVYTGKYKGQRVSLASHGFGGPSCAILVEEIIVHGAKYIVILGTTGTVVSHIDLGDYIIATEARHPAGGLYEGYKAQNDVKRPNKILLGKLTQAFKAKDLKFHTGSVYSNDSYFVEDKNFAKRRREEGILSVEMECATLFMLGKIRKVHTAAVLIASNTVKDKTYVPYKELEKKSEKAADAIFEAVKNFKKK